MVGAADISGAEAARAFKASVAGSAMTAVAAHTQ